MGGQGAALAGQRAAKARPGEAREGQARRGQAKKRKQASGIHFNVASSRSAGAVFSRGLRGDGATKPAEPGGVRGSPLS